MVKARSKHRLAAQAVLSDGQLVEGLDVSHFQGDIDWAAVASAAKHFAYIKATDGTSYTDPRYTRHYADSGSAGLLRGAYHFFRHGMPGADQASHFLNVANPRRGDLPPALDLEDPPAGQSVGDYLTQAAAWVSAVGAAIGGQAPMIYCSPSFWSDTLGGPDRFGSKPLWVAHYTTHDPTVPSPWSRFTFWQYTDSGSVSGISAKADLDRFHGSMDDLNALVLTGGGNALRARGIARGKTARAARSARQRGS